MFLQGLKGFPGVKGERVSNSHLNYTVPWRSQGEPCGLPCGEPFSAAAHTADAPVKTVGIIPASSGGGLGGDLDQCVEV